MWIVEKAHAWHACICVFISSCKATTEPSYVKFSHVEKGLVNGINTNVHTHTWCAHCSVVSDFAKVFLWVLCGHGIRARLSPGRAALIMRPLKMGRGLPALLLSKHHLNYSCKGQRRNSDNTEQEQSCTKVYIIKILSCRVGPHLPASKQESYNQKCAVTK